MLHTTALTPVGFVLRPYQHELKTKTLEAWAQGYKWVVLRLDTGGGKSPLIGSIVLENVGGVCVVAHRDILVIQLSKMLAQYGVRHDVVCSKKTRRIIIADHMDKFGKSFLDDNNRIKVASVDTLVRKKELANWASTVTLCVIDEAHHLVVDNKWHRATEMFTHPQLRGLGVTATPERADGKGLGQHADGLFEIMFQGPPMRWLIDNGFLTDYDVIFSQGDLAEIQEAVSASGDWSSAVLKKAAAKSHIVGDVVETYLKEARGLLGVTFATDVDTAKKMADKYNEMGVPAAVLTGETDPDLRRDILKKFEARRIMQIIAVDIISEGFDIPAIEVVSFARPTASLATYMQQFGRALRLLPGKLKALVIDHVGNIKRHGLPDKPRVWTLDGREGRRGGGGSTIPSRVCLGCGLTYRRILDACPFCGEEAPAPAGRSSPEQVDGDMIRLDPEILQAMRGEIEAFDSSEAEYYAQLLKTGLTPWKAQVNLKRRAEAQEEQKNLRIIMEHWGGFRTHEGLTVSQQQKLFFYRFGIDVMSAQVLGAKDAHALAQRVADDLFNNIDERVMKGL